MANTNPGRFLLKGKKNDTEIQQFEDLIKKRPDDDRAYVRLAELYARAGNEDKAIELYEKAAILFEKKGFLNKAKAVLKQALMINSEHGKINVLLADYDRQSG
ncbi:MAG TPA: tetratricopeptide repeat protein, partial [bacterium]|nr:tetratricopeptide repeat protein [bacterium]